MRETMASKIEHQQTIDQFESHYQYDSTYMREILASSLEGYQRFADFLPLAQYREHLPVEDFWVAKIAVMQVADCGACLQLIVKMAQEQGGSASVISSVLKNTGALPENLKMVVAYAQQLAFPAGVGNSLMEQMQSRYSHGQLLEFGLCAASAMVFPTIKRSIGTIQSCAIVNVEVA